jgi:ArsR family transcriptional regulator
MCVHCYKLASDEARHRILVLLKEGPLSVNAITGQMRISQPTVTHHLKRLAGAGLVRMQKKGRVHLYMLEKDSECFDECGLLKGLIQR